MSGLRARILEVRRLNEMNGLNEANTETPALQVEPCAGCGAIPGEESFHWDDCKYDPRPAAQARRELSELIDQPIEW